ncbi:unnamed protein product [Ceratitis capitata]|uniref:(Mediterranean fruit fly) hypothetical protein n=1 Tax=Ceratitis capitata TaxID=7213 RepID=A0A811UY87_CERCA|nr:unnamed protein product [Ceratitis capitata]
MAPVGRNQQHNQKSAHMHQHQHQQQHHQHHYVAHQHHQQPNAHTHPPYAARRHSNTATTTTGTPAGLGGGSAGAMGLAMPGSSSSQRESLSARRPADTTVSGSTMYSRGSSTSISSTKKSLNRTRTQSYNTSAILSTATFPEPNSGIKAISNRLCVNKILNCETVICFDEL